MSAVLTLPAQSPDDGHLCDVHNCIMLLYTCGANLSRRSPQSHGNLAQIASPGLRRTSAEGSRRETLAMRLLLGIPAEVLLMLSRVILSVVQSMHRDPIAKHCLAQRTIYVIAGSTARR